MDKDQDNSVPENNDKPAQSPPAPPPVEPRYTDKDVDKLKGSARKEGRNSGRSEREQELLSEAGYESVDDLLTAAKDYKLVEESNQSELQQVTTQRDSLKTARDKAIADRDAAREELKQERINFALESKLRDKGINKDRLSLALKVADTSGVTVTDSGFEGLDDAAEEVLTNSPEWFQAKERNGRVSATGRRDERQQDNLRGGERISAYFNQRR